MTAGLPGTFPEPVEGPLVLLPGTLCDARLFAPLIDRLSRDTLVLPLVGGNVEDAARHVLAAAPPRFALLGYSLGGMVALAVADRIAISPPSAPTASEISFI